MSAPLVALYAVVRGVIYIALLLLVGAQILGLVIKYAGPSDATGVGRDLRARLGRAVTPAAVILLIAALVRGAFQVGTFLDPGDSVTADLVRSVLLNGTWAHAWILQLAAAIVLICALPLRRKRGVAPDTVIAIIVMVILWGETGMGHGAGDTWPWVTGRIAYLTHLAGIGMWIGTVGMMLLVALPVLSGEERLRELASVVKTFSIFGRTGAALVVISGVTIAGVYSRLSIELIVHSTWGRLLLLKLTAFVGVLALGWYNWKVVTPELEMRATSAEARLRRAVRIELALGAIMLAITTVLVVSALPGE
jgi:putative copper export protein